MEATLNADDYIQRLVSKEVQADQTDEEAHMDKVFKIKQNISFLAKVIPAFVYKHYAKFGIEEMQDLLYNRLLKMTVQELKDLAFSM